MIYLKILQSNWSMTHGSTALFTLFKLLTLIKCLQQRNWLSLKNKKNQCEWIDETFDNAWLVTGCVILWHSSLCWNADSVCTFLIYWSWVSTKETLTNSLSVACDLESLCVCAPVCACLSSWKSHYSRDFSNTDDMKY